MKNSRSETSIRSVRADAKKNNEIILKAALEIFQSNGIDVPIREIAKHAGVGIGTIYRHFPQRSDLIYATLINEIDACVYMGEELISEKQPEEALINWVKFYIEFIIKTQGLATALNSGDQTLAGLSNYFHEQLCPIVEILLHNAIKSKIIQKKISADELLCAISALCAPHQHQESSNEYKLVFIFIDGLRIKS
ncbi:TetR/AcrR family transcriptional regulator [Acinetobacter seifertii]|uniref:TetR/AcrR family transcriptional regulator n=1 Tax=Acinetobacter seifertii TaxID=1530123 RepID=UPI000C1E04A8|nr:helix-turn-helix domain-containing protein [Acinetobacter seifertii]PJF02543.1 TetR family transcriptional regulator [Acinetobacter seifertii]PJG68656.1 TetR family transcriptional regulator [Acinetobacter seifertii]